MIINSLYGWNDDDDAGVMLLLGYCCLCQQINKLKGLTTMKDNTAWMRVFSTEHRQSMSYVTEDGNYGSDMVLVFPTDALTEKHWEVVRTLSDNDRLDFVKLILDGQDTSEYMD